MMPKGIGSRLILLILVGVGLTGLFSVNLLGNALAYTEDDPAVKYQCFEKNKDGSYNKTAEGNLIPCPIDHGDNAWMLTSSALVLMMTPAGLAIFYGGLARQKNAVNTLHMVFITTGVIAMQWALFGYSLAFGPDAGGYGFIGTLDWAGLNNVLHDVPSIAYGGIGPNNLCADCGTTTIPHQTYMIFQMMFAIITPGSDCGSIGRTNEIQCVYGFYSSLGNICLRFCCSWTWELAPDNYGANPGYAAGWTGKLGLLDFAGGTVIHITSGWSGLVIALMLGRRLGYGKIPMEPHNIGMVVLGGALLMDWLVWIQCWVLWSRHKCNKCICCNPNSNWYGSSNLGINIMGSYRKTIYCGWQHLVL